MSSDVSPVYPRETIDELEQRCAHLNAPTQSKTREVEFVEWWNSDEAIQFMHRGVADIAFASFRAGYQAAIAAVKEGGPVTQFNWNEGEFEWLTTYKYSEHHMAPLYKLPEEAK